MTLIRALPFLLVLGLGTGCQGFGTLGLKKNNDMTGQEAVAKLEANRPAGEKLPEIVALPPAPPPAITPAPYAPPPAPAFAPTTAKASSKGDTTAMAGASFDDEEVVVPRRKPAPKKPEAKSAKPSAGVHAKTYVVQRGDTLQKISQKFYGTTKSWQKIFEANKAKMKKPDVVIAGMVLQIP